MVPLGLTRGCGDSSDSTDAPPSPKSSSLLRRRGDATPLVIAIERQSTPITAPRDILHDNFVITKSLGQGSMSTVFHAARKSDCKEFAVKVVASDDPAVLQVLRDEYELLCRLDHPNIVRAQDLIAGENKALLVLDLVDGSNLLTAVRRAPNQCFSEAKTLPLSRMLLEAVDYLHKNRIVHRDIKPHNILVTHDLRHLKLADFNVARCLVGCCALTPTGTRLYAAPEVVLGQAAPNERSDVWSLGVCIYFMLAGHLPQERDRCVHEHAMRAAAERPVLLDQQFWAEVSESCKSMLHQALELEWTMRSAPMVLLQCKWFQDGTLVRPVASEKYGSVRSQSMPIFVFDSEDSSACSDVGYDLASMPSAGSWISSFQKIRCVTPLERFELPDALRVA